MKRLDDKWYPISELPEEFKDGRAVLIWHPKGEPYGSLYTLSQYFRCSSGDCWLRLDKRMEIETKIVTHFREIVSPQEEALRDLVEHEERMGLSY